MADALDHYERREEELGEQVMREVERQVMLRIIDQRWREHLEEMDYLKEGINLRAMGQKDPLTEWQREGYEMFGAMMKGIAQDFVRYVMHVQVVRNDQPPATRAERAADVVGRPSRLGLRPRRGGCVRTARTRTRRRRPRPRSPLGAPTRAGPAPAAKQETVVKDEWAKTPRNAPCPCGSGKKFKMCHGASLTAPGSR